jgi:hypothetical protein
MQRSVVNIEFSAVPANELNSAIPHQRVAFSNLTEPENFSPMDFNGETYLK